MGQTGVSDYMAHGYCFSWEPGLLWLHVVSDLLTGIAYFSIPAALFYFVHKRRDLPFLDMFILFGLFIIACGATHFFAVYTIFVPAYWPEGIVKAITACVSVIAVIRFIPLIPKAIALPGLANTAEELRKKEAETKQLAQENAIIAEIGRIISSTLNIEEVYGRFAEEVRTLISFDRVAATIINLKDRTYTRIYSSGIEAAGYPIGQVSPLAGSTTELMLERKSGLIIQAETEGAPPDPYPDLAYAPQAGMQSKLSVPLISKDQVIGALHLRSRKANAYTKEDLRIAGTIAAQIAGAVANAELFQERRRAEESLRQSEEEARRLARENELLAEIGRIISSTLNIEEVYDRFARKVREAIPFDRITVNTVNLEDHTRTVRYVFGHVLLHTRVGDTRPVWLTPTEEIIRTRASLLVNSKNREEMKKRFPHARSLQAGSESSMFIPLLARNEVRGIFVLHSRDRDVYGENDLKLAERVANQIAGAITSAELYAEHHRLDRERRDLEERLHRAEKMEALGTLAGGVAHDLNNVLGVLSGYSELLREEIPEGSRLRSYVDNILTSSEKGASIIADLLTLARRGVAAAEVANLNRIVSSFLQSPVYEKLRINHPQVTFRTDLAPELLNIKGSPLHLEKTVMNLISNAADSITGKGDVLIRTENRYLDRAIRGYDHVAEGEYVVLTVSDTGGGIAADDLDKIFEPFYTKKKMGRSGTGLGLAIVWGTVKDHNGYIDVQSEWEAGSTFTLYFPTTRERTDGDLKKIPVAQYLGQGEMILVVDDVPQQREMATRMLTRLGYRVSAVSGGEEALEYLKTGRADMMILDMIMSPGMDGLETYRRVLAINPHQKAILVSGFSETDRVREAQELGAGAYVRKPYLLETIGLAIRNELLKVR